MPIQYPTEVDLPGPWLLEDQALLQLEQILDEEWNHLESRRNALIEDEANEKVQQWQKSGLLKTAKERKEKLKEFIEDPPYTLQRSKINVTLFLKNKGTYPTEKFSLALRDNALLDEVVTGFSVDMESADFRCRISTKSWSDELHIDVSPENTTEAREIYVSLRNWAEKNSPPYWQLLWKKIDNINWYIWLCLVLIGAFIWSTTLSNSVTNAKQRARDLLDTGITQQNLTEAIELSLIIQTEYDPTTPPVNKNIPSWLKILFWSGLILNILLSFRAKTLLGIGKGRKLIINWKIWNKLVGITIPGLLFTSFVWPLLVEWFLKLIR